MKKTLLAVILSFITFSMWADDSGNCGTNLSWNYIDETLTISGSGEMIDFQEDGNNCPWNKYKKDIFFVNIESGVTSIGNYAFSQCVQLTGINIPDGLTSIGEYAFSGCTELRMDQRCSALKGIKIPNTVTSIGNYAFSGCKCLTSIELSNNIVAIKQGVFEYCKGLTSITIPNSVTRIGQDAFYQCTGLSSVNIGNNVNEIDPGAFMDCSGMTSITIPNSVTSIGNYAFWGCSGLTSITIPNSVMSIGSDAFYGCDNLISIVVEEGNPTYDSRDNCNAIIKTASNSLFIGCQNTNIPISVTSIDEGAFRNCTGLTSITIPSSVTFIGGSAFFGCNGLTSITIPNSVTSIGEYAFGMCSGLTSITIPNSITSIGTSVFSSCEGLTSVTIPNSVTNIGVHAFSGCIGLTSVTIPESVTSIGISAFSYCKNLTSITIPSSVTNIREEAFAYTAWLDNQPDGLVYAGNVAYVYKGTMPEKSSITIKSGTQSISNYAFSGCGGLTSVNIPSSVLRIGGHAFDGTAWLDNQPNGLVYAGNIAYAYKGVMPNNTSIIIKDGTVSISDYAFRNYKTLTSITIPYSVTRIGGSAFYNCTGLSSVNIGNNVKEIDNAAFSGCTSLTSISIPNSVTSIDSNAFRDCSGLTSVTIGNNVMSIGNYAFSGCSGLMDVFCYADNVPSTPSNAFNNSSINNATLHVSGASIDLYKAVVPWKYFKEIVKIDMLTYTLTYIVDDEVYKTFEIEEGEDITPEPAPLKEGYSFSGWSEIPETMPAHDVTITGYFTANKYNLIYQVDGEEYKTYEVEYGATITPENDPTKEGYTFSGWSKIPKTMPAHDVTVSGTFAINTYKLIYMIDGEEYKSLNVEYGATITPEAEPTKEGYIFSGWSEIPETMPAHDVTVTGTFTLDTGLSQIMSDENGDAMIFTIDGKRVNKLQKNLNIIRMKDGTTRKVIKK